MAAVRFSAPANACPLGFTVHHALCCVFVCPALRQQSPPRWYDWKPRHENATENGKELVAQLNIGAHFDACDGRFAPSFYGQSFPEGVSSWCRKNFVVDKSLFKLSKPIKLTTATEIKWVFVISA